MVKSNLSLCHGFAVLRQMNRICKKKGQKVFLKKQKQKRKPTNRMKGHQSCYYETKYEGEKIHLEVLAVHQNCWVFKVTKTMLKSIKIIIVNIA